MGNWRRKMGNEQLATGNSQWAMDNQAIGNGQSGYGQLADGQLAIGDDDASLQIANSHHINYLLFPSVIRSLHYFTNL